MEQSANYAAGKDAQIKLSKEKYALGMGQRSKDSREECTNHAQKGGVCVRHGAKVKRNQCSREGCTNQAKKEEFVWDMGRTSTQTQTMQIEVEGCAHCFQFRMNSLRYDTLDLTSSNIFGPPNISIGLSPKFVHVGYSCFRRPLPLPLQFQPLRRQSPQPIQEVSKESSSTLDTSCWKFDLCPMPSTHCSYSLIWASVMAA